DALELRQHVRAAGLVGHKELALVADALRRDVLIGLRLLDDSGRMNAGLGRERAFADIRRMTIRRPVEEFVEPMRDAHDAAERAVADVDLELVGIFRLELQRRDDGDEIGIAAALTEPVERALDLPRAGTNGGKTVGDGLFGVIVGVNSDAISGYDFADFANDVLDFVWQRAAIG